MNSAMLSLRVLGKDGATMSRVVEEGSGISSSPDSRVRKDAPSSHKLTSSLGELNVRSVSCDRSYSRILLANSICYSFIVSIILVSLAKLLVKI